MPELHGSHTRMYANGLDISSMFKESEVGRKRELRDATGYGSTGTKHSAARVAMGSMNASGMLDVDPDTGARPVMDTLQAAEASLDGDAVISWMARDTTIGDPGFIIEGSVANLLIKPILSDLTQTAFEAQANRSMWAKALHPKAARTAAHSSTGLDNGASSAFGGLGALQVFALSGSTPVLTAKLQHSSDSTNGTDGTWVDLATFATVNAAAVTAGYGDAVRVTGTVNRWLRINVAVTSGSLTSVTFAAQFGRYTALR